MSSHDAKSLIISDSHNHPSSLYNLTCQTEYVIEIDDMKMTENEHMIFM